MVTTAVVCEHKGAPIHASSTHDWVICPECGDWLPVGPGANPSVPQQVSARVRPVRLPRRNYPPGSLQWWTSTPIQVPLFASLALTLAGLLAAALGLRWLLDSNAGPFAVSCPSCAVTGFAIAFHDLLTWISAFALVATGIFLILAGLLSVGEHNVSRSVPDFTPAPTLTTFDGDEPVSWIDELPTDELFPTDD